MQTSPTRTQTDDADHENAPLQTPSDTPVLGAGAGAGFNVRDLVISLIVNGALPFLTYRILRDRGMGELPALVISGVFPAIATVVSVARARRVDILGGFALAGIAVGVVAALIGGEPKLVLIRESFLTATLGVIALISLLTARPMMFLIGRQAMAGNDPKRIVYMNRAMEIPKWRRFFRTLTLIWGVVWIAEFTLRVILVYTLSIEQVLIVAPIIFNTITFGLIGLTLLFVRRERSGSRATH